VSWHLFNNASVLEDFSYLNDWTCIK